MMEHVIGFRCVECGEVYPASPPQMYTCARCGIDGILDILYDYAAVGRTLTRESLATRDRTIWRYEELLPIARGATLPPLQVGWTPVYDAPRLAEAYGVARLWLKDDGRNPTGSFKDRASAVGVVKAREHGAATIACASTGNAASSLAGFAASIGLPSFIFVPAAAPEPKVAQLLMFGATVLAVRGSYDDAYYLCQDACAEFGWYNRNCAVNPYLVEGKKSVGLEIGERFATGMPDWVVFAVGDGCTIAGAWKGIDEMHRLGLCDRRPRMLGVQAEGARPIVDAFLAKERVRGGPALTLADSIAVGKPRNWRKALGAIEASGGAMIAVTDDEILAAMRQVARKGGVFGEPAGATAAAGLRLAVERGIVERDETALVVITGNGLKDIRSALRAVSEPGRTGEVPNRPIEVEPSLGSLKDALAGARAAIGTA